MGDVCSVMVISNIIFSFWGSPYSIYKGVGFQRGDFSSIGNVCLFVHY